LKLEGAVDSDSDRCRSCGLHTIVYTQSWFQINIALGHDFVIG